MRRKIVNKKLNKTKTEKEVSQREIALRAKRKERGTKGKRSKKERPMLILIVIVIVVVFVLAILLSKENNGESESQSKEPEPLPVSYNTLDAKDEATKMAKDFLKKQSYADQYDLDSAETKNHKEFWNVWFNKKDQEARPNKGLVQVSKGTGEAEWKELY